LHFLCFHRHNTEKVIYFLLLDRKLRQPTLDDSDDAKQRSRSGSRKKKKKKIRSKRKKRTRYILADFPQKRIDRQRSNGSIGGASNRSGIVAQLTEGSPLVPRRQLYTSIA